LGGTVRFAVDTGGTFTDLVIEDDDGRLSMTKSSTRPSDPVAGVFDVLDKAAASRGLARGELLEQADLFIHGTTRAINAILTHSTARTAFLTSAGHPDVLLFREGGRSDPFNFTRPFPEPYVPRSLTFEVPGRIGSRGEEVEPLDEAALAAIAAELARHAIEAVAVCLLWSIVNPVHEQRTGELLAELLPDVPVTLSHALNPTIREYRRGSSTAIDASLKPLMSDYLGGLESRLRAAGFGGRLLVVTSSGGVMDAGAVAAAPIHAINSGPAMAPVAGRHYAELDGRSSTAIVADTGGTSYDVSVVQRGRLPQTRETWLGTPYFGHMTGFPSVDVKSIGAGGGSIAWVDSGGLLHVGPQSAGAEPGPVCYGRGGERPTVTDACVVLGYLDPSYFLGGDMPLRADAAAQALTREVAEPLGLACHEAADAVLALATEHMVYAIEDITINQGIDPRDAVLIGGGGAAGLNAVAIAERLRCAQVIVPQTGAALSAAGALLSDLSSSSSRTLVTNTASFDHAAVDDVLEALEAECDAFIAGPGAGTESAEIEMWAEVRYPQQVWQLDVPLRSRRLPAASDVATLREDFHAVHLEVFAVNDPHSEAEIVAWHGRARCRLREDRSQPRMSAPGPAAAGERDAYFAQGGWLRVPVVRFEALEPAQPCAGPCIVESSFTTVVVPPGASYWRTEAGSLGLTPPARARALDPATPGGTRDQII
jgi:N-methylhydantoinase A